MALVLAAPAIPSPPAPAGAAPCLTHREARAKWPAAHLYWHTDERCWDNQAKGTRYEDRPRMHLQIMPANVATTVVPVDQAMPERHTTVFYPELTVNTWPSNAATLQLSPHEMSSWPLLLDVDVPARFDTWRDRVGGTAFK